MIEVVLSVAGGLLIVATLVDVVATVISVAGGHGVISNWVGRALSRFFKAVYSRTSSRVALVASGPAIFIAITLVWALALIVGWMLVFAPDGALKAADNGHIGLWDHADQASALVFGGSSPLVNSAGQPWSFFARMARFSGLGLSSFGLAYALPVVGGVVTLRTTARNVSSLRGPDGTISATARLDGQDSVLHLFLINLTGDLTHVAQQLNAYPILPFFHSTDGRAAMSQSLSDLLDFLDQRDGSTSTVPTSVCVPLERSIDAVLEAADRVLLQPHAPAPEDPADRRRFLVELWRAHDGLRSTSPPPHVTASR